MTSEDSSTLLDRSHPIPLYYQLKSHLEVMIRDYQVGNRLPSEQELAEMFGVSRPTVRQALAELVSEGKLEKRRGLGSYVSRPKLDNTLTSTISLAQQLDAAGLDYCTRVLTRELRQADDDLARHLGVEPRTEILYIERLRILEEEPFYFAQDFLLHDLCGGLFDADLLHCSLFNCVERACGVTTARVQRHLEATLADAVQAELLEVSPGFPVLYLQTYAFTDTDRLWGYFRDFFRADRTRFSFAITRVGAIEMTQTVATPALDAAARRRGP